MMVVLQLWALLAGATFMVAGESFTNGWATKLELQNLTANGLNFDQSKQ